MFKKYKQRYLFLHQALHLSVWLPTSIFAAKQIHLSPEPVESKACAANSHCIKENPTISKYAASDLS